MQASAKDLDLKAGDLKQEGVGHHLCLQDSRLVLWVLLSLESGFAIGT